MIMNFNMSRTNGSLQVNSTGFIRRSFAAMSMFVRARSEHARPLDLSLGDHLHKKNVLRSLFL